MFTIRWSRSSEKFLVKLPKDNAKRIVKKVDSLNPEPFKFLEHFEDSDSYKLRIGDYRALIDVDYKQMLLEVRVLDHRKKVYKKK